MLVGMEGAAQATPRSSGGAVGPWWPLASLPLPAGGRLAGSGAADGGLQEEHGVDAGGAGRAP